MTPDEYLDQLPADRRAELTRVRDLIRKHLPDGYVESIQSGMIAYEIPLSTYPKTYNKKPLVAVALAAQKNHNSLHLPSVYMSPALDETLRAGFERAGKKPDMGKGCVRFKSAGDLPLEAIGKIIAAVGVKDFIATYEAARGK